MNGSGATNATQLNAYFSRPLLRSEVGLPLARCSQVKSPLSAAGSLLSHRPLGLRYQQQLDASMM